MCLGKRERDMTSKQTSVLIGIALLTVLNLVLLGVNLSMQAKAEVAGMSKSQLYRDRDFRGAVEYIVESCKVSRDSISC
jgi:hypothetical protein